MIRSRVKPRSGRARYAILAVAGFVLSSLASSVAWGQAVSILVSNGTGNAPNNDGGYPNSALVCGADGNFYGTTGIQIYSSNYFINPGTVFQVTPQGVETVITQFSQGYSYSGYSYEYDPYLPSGGLTAGADGSLYGTTQDGGANNAGVFFRVTPGANVASSYTQISSLGGGSFGYAENAGPLLQGSDGNFYESVPYGDISNGSAYFYEGAILSLTPQGTESIPYLFGSGSNSNDGEQPNGGLIQASDGSIYGTCEYGGSGPDGAIFKLVAGQESILHNFGDGTVSKDGLFPTAGLIQGSDGNFYGTTTAGGSVGLGTIYKMTPAGVVTILHNFGDGSVSNDGTAPAAALIQGSDGNFYGTTPSGGRAGAGVVFELTPQGVYTILHNFNDGTVANDGSGPTAALLQGPDGNLYGTTVYGGAANEGTIFSINLDLPALTSAPTVSGTASVPLTYRAVASQGTQSFSATNLPSGLSIDATSGLITGTPATAGTTVATITMTNDVQSSTALVTFNIASLPAPVIGGFLSAYGSVNTPFSYSIIASDNPTGYTSSTLPAGLTLDPTTGIISGTPTTPGTTSVQITATNATGPTSATLNIVISNGALNLSQAYVIVHRFNDGSVTNDGEYPTVIFQGFDGSLYGTTQAGGTSAAGTIFNISPQGTASIFASIGAVGASASADPPRSADGLLEGCDGNFYGTAEGVGASDSGEIYSLTPDGQITILHHFGDGSIPNDGTDPTPGLIQASDGNFYGTTEFGGTANEGCAYMMTPRGAIKILHNFGDGSVTNDGQFPSAGLTQGPDGNFYGMTFGGGSSAANAGTIFQMTPAGVVTIIHKFGDGTVTNDGAEPAASLFLGDDGNFYGTTPSGGSFDSGCIFKVTTAGIVTILHSFGDGTVTNDGDTPEGPLIEGYDTNFYGTTSVGGSAGEGTVFSVTKAGVVTILHSFGDGSTTNDGSYPIGITQAVNGNFYGTTETGGSGNGYGTVFAILAGQIPTQVPIFTGSSYEAGVEGEPFVFIPKALFGSSIMPGGAGGTSVAKPALITPDTSGTGITYWTESGNLPNLLQFNSTSGEINHDPIVQGTFPIDITPHNNIGAGATNQLTFYFDVPPVVSSPTTAYASVGLQFTYPITVQSGYPFPSVFGMTGFPGWLSIDTNTGVVSGTPPGPGVYPFTVTASNIFTPVNAPSTQLVMVVVSGGSPSSPQISSATAVAGTAGTPLTYTILASNNPTSYGALVLPPGLTCNATTGIISGTPTTQGRYPVPVSATNGSGMSGAEVTFTIAPSAVPVIPGPLAAATVVNTPFSYQIPETGLVSIYGAYLQSDPNQTELPPGLNFDINTGILSGTPTSSGVYVINLSAANNFGTAATTLTLTVGGSNTFTSWENEYNFTGSEGATPKGDSVPNLLKFLYDINPNETLTAEDRKALPSVSYNTTANPGTDYLTLTYRKYALAAGITVNVQSSTDLQNWSTVTPDLQQQVGNDPTTGDPIMEVGVNVTNVTTPKFIRLNVSAP